MFTVDEETGMTGAFGFDGNMLSGKTILNLDTEEFGKLYIGCAGGGDTTVRVQLEAEPTDNMLTMNFSLFGLMGGHSGVNIDEYRGNAVVLGCKALKKMVECGLAQVHSIQGGEQSNAIPREFFATILAQREHKAACESVLAATIEAYKKEFGIKEPGIACALTPADHNDGKSSTATRKHDQALNLLRFMCLLPNGPLKYSHEVKGLVETSNNVASIKSIGDGALKIVCSSRSFLSDPLEDVRDQIATLAELCGYTATKDLPYPGWAPRADS